MPSFDEQSQIEVFATDTLNNFFPLQDKRPMRNFIKGELFDASQFSEGTVLKISYEKLFFDHYKVLPNRMQKQNYHPYVTWGVVCGYNTDGARNATIASYWILPMAFNSHELVYANIVNSPVAVGSVRHRKEKNIFGEINQLLRVNGVQIYEFGKKFRAKAESQLPSLNLGLQF
jgi:hypothetical protein